MRAQIAGKQAESASGVQNSSEGKDMFQGVFLLIVFFKRKVPGVNDLFTLPAGNDMAGPPY